VIMSKYWLEYADKIDRVDEWKSPHWIESKE